MDHAEGWICFLAILDPGAMFGLFIILLYEAPGSGTPVVFSLLDPIVLSENSPAKT